MVNALSIKPYIQMHLERNKTDRKGAGRILAIEQRPASWEAYFESKQLYNTIREYTEQTKGFNNQLHSLGLLPVPGKGAIQSLEKEMVGTKARRIAADVATRPVQKCREHQGHWQRATAMLIVFTQGFRHSYSS